MKMAFRMRIFILLLAFCLGLVVLYVIIADNKFYFQGLEKSQKVSDKIKEINDLVYFTQHPNHLEEQKLHEAVILEKAGKLSEHLAEKLTLSTIHLKQKLIHLDLKGAPPRVEYFKKVFPLFHHLGASGILVEYEDTFPYSGSVQLAAARNSYSKDDINKINILAEQNGLEVIPLVQTFGHMEFVLKLDEFLHLREVPHNPQAICPSSNDSITILKSMLDQVIQLHKGIKHIHIGCDEVWALGYCQRCQNRMIVEHWEKENLFLNHVKTIASYIKTTYGIQPIVWDDMFRHISLTVLKKFQIADFVNIMVWHYSPKIDDHLDEDTWQKYSKTFSSVWIASSFKGATGPKQLLPSLQYHLLNHYSWLFTMKKYSDKISFTGIALTGWQRYDHFATLCELLPASIPSLALDLLYMKYGRADMGVLKKLQEILQCDKPFKVFDSFNNVVTCQYPGAKVYSGISRFREIIQQKNTMLNDNHFVGWLSSYNVKFSFSSPEHVIEATRNLSEIMSDLKYLHEQMDDELSSIYDVYSVKEWIQTIIEPELSILETIQKEAQSLLKRNSWPQRPLN